MAGVESAQRLVKPKLRGVFHEIGFYVAAATGVALVVTADPGRARTAGGDLCRLRGRLLRRQRRLPPADVAAAGARPGSRGVDHAGVYLLIAGSYAPFGLIVMSEGWAIPVLAIVWGGALPRDPAQALLAAGAEVALGCDRPDARLGGSRRLLAAAANSLPLPSRSSSPPGSFTAPGRSSMRDAAPTRIRLSSGITSSSTC